MDQTAKELLEQMPELLRNKTIEYLEQHPGSKLLSYQNHKSTLYKDKTIVSTFHTSFIEYVNLMVVLRHERCSDPDFDEIYKNKIHQDSMIAGDILEFLRHSDWFNRWEEKKI